jgi:hypothetical protein
LKAPTNWDLHLTVLKCLLDTHGEVASNVSWVIGAPLS